MRRILGIDPGLQRTGWGIIDQDQNRLSFVGCGIITSNAKDDMAKRIHDLSTGIQKIIAEFHPHHGSIEETFVNKNPNSTLKLGLARGACLLTLAQHDLTIGEYSANQIKKTLTGQGHADKNQVLHMVKMLLPASGPHLEKQKSDASDALAIAICHAHHL